jgi:phenolic acid decarboxylase
VDNLLRWEDGTSYNWGIAEPDDAPEAEVTGSDAALTGNYIYQYTYVRKEGTTVVCESNPSDSSTSVTASSKGIRISWTEPTDTQVTHIRFYRTTGTGATLYYVGEADAESVDHDYAYTQTWEETGEYATGTGYKVTGDDDNTHSWEPDDSTSDRIGADTADWRTRYFWDTVADTGLGSQVATNHDTPPAGTYVAGPNYNGIIFIIKDNNLHFSLTKQPEYFPAAYFVEVSPPDDPGVCVVFFNGQPYYLTTHRIYHIQGTGSTTFFPFDMKAITGAQSKHGALAVKGHGIYHVGPDGVYLYSGQDKKITQNSFDPIFRGETTNGIPGVVSLSDCWLKQWRNQIYFCYDEENVLVFNLDNNRVTYYNYPYTLQYGTVDQDGDRLLASDGAGTYYELEDKDATQDGSTDIDWELRSKDFTLQTRAHFPRWVKYDIDASSATTCTGTLYLDDVAHQVHTITGSRSTKRRLVTTGNGERCALGLSGSGPVSIYAMESE